MPYPSGPFAETSTGVPCTMRKLIILALFASFFAPVMAENLEGDYLYRVTTVRAAPGSLADLINWHGEVMSSGYFAKSGEAAPMVLRHSQGDHWDLMFISPMGSFTNYYSKPSVVRRDAAAEEFADLLAASDKLLAFSEDHFAYGPPDEILRESYASSGLFHIEMFAAVPGKVAELLQQRRMENDYLAATNLQTNYIFRRAAGSDIDVFTIGFHESLESFAVASDMSDEAKEAAAKAAGFKDRADISFYLRSLMSSHHDTLAGKLD